MDRLLQSERLAATFSASILGRSVLAQIAHRKNVGNGAMIDVWGESFLPTH